VAKKISNSLVTLSSAAILAVYAAGYERTTPAANRFAAQTAQRRAPVVNETPVVLPNATAPVQMASAAPAPVVSKPVAKTPEKVSFDDKPATPSEIPAENPATPAPAQAQPATTEQPPVAAVPDKAVEPDPAPPSVPQVQSQPVYKDGLFLGWGYSRHGNIQAFVRIEAGRIVHVGIQRCETRWPCDLVAHLPGQVIARQSAEVDYVTGATQSGDAFYGAIVAALAQAK